MSVVGSECNATASGEEGPNAGQGTEDSTAEGRLENAVFGGKHARQRVSRSSKELLRDKGRLSTVWGES